ncbi:hypothetical protein OBK30_14135 [Empedobacter falsenii]
MKTLKYILGIFFIIGSLGTLVNGSVLSSVFTLALGVSLLPPISDQFKEKFKLWQSKGIRYITYIMLLIISSITSVGMKDFESKKTVSKKEFIVEYIKKDTLDKSLTNIRDLAEIGGLFGNHNFSLNNIKSHISEHYDSLNKNTIITFNPEFDFTDEDRTTYLVENKKNGKLQDYILEFTLNNKNEIISKKTVLKYSKSGVVEYKNEEIPSLNNFVNNETVDNMKETIAIEKKALIDKEEHEKKIRNFEENCLSSWDHSHRGIIKLVKQSMHNPKSFEHVETKYGITDDYAGIIMVYRGTNMYGAIVTNTIKAKINLDDCSIISIEE